MSEIPSRSLSGLEPIIRMLLIPGGVSLEISAQVPPATPPRISQLNPAIIPPEIILGVSLAIYIGISSGILGEIFQHNLPGILPEVSQAIPLGFF